MPIEFLNCLITPLHDSRQLGWIKSDSLGRLRKEGEVARYYRGVDWADTEHAVWVTAALRVAAGLF
ncbi:MAG: hypothetical protein ACE5JN_11025 [Candidatus Methylomirabilia bacterium]